MREAHIPAASAADAKCAPLHEEIAQCSRDLWVQFGKPADRNLAIWLEAEHRLLSVAKLPHGKNSGPAPSFGLPPPKSGTNTPKGPKQRSQLSTAIP